METKSDSAANTEMRDYWNGAAGEKWVRLESILDEQLRPFGDAVLAAARLQPGEHVLDVGCGCGATTLEAARAVASKGRAIGADLSRGMLERARQRAQSFGLAQAHFEAADAQVHPFGRSVYDAVISRFGVMFFENPEAAFANLARAAKRGGRLAFVCWQSVAVNPWMALPMMAALQFVKLDRPSDPNAPGPFAFADADRVRSILASSGWTSVNSHSLELDMSVGGGVPLAEAADFMMEMGPTAQPLREADAATRERVRAAVTDALAPYATPRGVRMAAAAWVFTARAAD
jgi:SAM-dependent methyltransferase